MNKYVPAIGNPRARIVLVGEAPSYAEEEKEEPFVGPSGKFLDHILRQIGLSRSDIWITNVSKFMVAPQPKEGKKIPFPIRCKMAGVDYDQQVSELRSELFQIQPNIVVLLGASALWAVTNKSPLKSWRGSIIPGMGFKCIATYHPAHFLHMEGDVQDYWQREIMILDLARAKEESMFSEIVLPSRALTIARHSGDLYDFEQRYRESTDMSVDIEAAGNCIPACIGLSFNKHEGITVPLWNRIDGVDISSIPDADLVQCWIILARLLATKDITGQNFGYDKDRIKRLGFIVNKLKHDTMLKYFSMQPELPKNLAFLTSVYTKEPFYKNDGMYKGKIEDLLIGCARDACVTKEISDLMEPELDHYGVRQYYENFLMPLHELYCYIENNGVAVDETIREQIIRRYVKWTEDNRYELFQIAGHSVNTSSPLQVSKLLYEEWKLPYKGGTGEEVLTMILNGKHADERQKRAINLILTDRRVKKTIGTYLLTPTDFDGRMRTSYFICLNTGRSSTQQQEEPIRPSIEVIRTNDEGKKEKKNISMGCAFQTLTKHGDIGPEVRKMYKPDEGHCFIQADSAQAEARVTAKLAKDDDMLERYDIIDIHAWTASLFFNKPIEEYDKKIVGYEKPERFIGKMLRHAGERGMGKRRAAIEVNTNAKKYKVDIEMSEGEADRHLKTLHRSYPRLENVYFKEVQACLDLNRRLYGPVPYGIESRTGGLRIFFERYGEELFRQAYSYLPQRTVTDNTKAAALRIHKRASWIKILIESHDSLLATVREERKIEAASIMKEEFERPIDFSGCSLSRTELIIPCEIEIGYDYYEMSKFKFIPIEFSNLELQ